MPWYNEGNEGSNFIKLQDGDDMVLTVKKIEKLANPNPKYNLSKRDFYFKFTTDKGVLSVNTWSLYIPLSNSMVNEGDTFTLSCSLDRNQKKIYRVKLMSKGVEDMGSPVGPPTDEESPF